jgi:hypothetical protein
MSFLLNTAPSTSSAIMHDSEDRDLLASLNAEECLIEGEPEQYQGLVVHADLAEIWKKFVILFPNHIPRRL